MSLKKKLQKLIAAQKKHHEPDRILIYLILTIVVFGLVSLSSASSVLAYDRFGDAYYFLKNQMFGLVIGLAAFLVFCKKLIYHLWQKYAFGFLIFFNFFITFSFYSWP